MAGKKGRSGGIRVGAGRPPDKPVYSKAKGYITDDPDAFLRTLMRDTKMPVKDRITAALALRRPTPLGRPPGKREQAQADAEAVVGRRSLKPGQPPKKGRHLRIVK